MNYLEFLLFGVYPYLAGTVFLLGSLLRFDRDQFTWKASSSQILNTEDMRRTGRWAMNLFHIGILFLFLGHFVGLLTPPSVFHALGVSAGAKQILAVSAGGIAGTMCFVGLTLLVRRRLGNPRVRATSSRMDIVILLMLYAQLILGLATIPVSLMHLDGHDMLLLMKWAHNTVLFNPTEAVAALS
ncbi:MAG: respiratory nitrate reductase subunit gamma, partial [Phycisphaerales bacterium]|nr:respiratory nitrate reductase subunit gamma [Phycisphaerales bacterium]